MKFTKFLWLAILAGSLAIAGCKSGGQEGGEAAEGSAAAEAAPAAEGSAAAEPAAEPATQPAAEPAAEGSAAAAPAAPVADPNFVAAAESLHGTWAADFQAMLAGQEMAAEERALAQAMLGSATMDLTFAADGTMTMNGQVMGQVQTQSGTWAAVGNTGNVLTISTTLQNEGSDAETQTMTVTFVNADAMTMADDKGESIPFTRKAAQ